ncbi:hypothetical protein HNQ93_001761 [Hymenobacter luteus]|uniref:DUF4178 domain-containing protein n=2 Tax=Hymenobacter TaxID=89966 RepID=A0A7W9T005_9BACT|nr:MULTISPECIES: DUF4178 domain-containing protein [Hymenobacter]MBB4600878.1 hypothetical protein [Hymenobacter latericoloratus]MBB6058915.1 hypothetical protein [Hymenobacter luteus]
MSSALPPPAAPAQVECPSCWQQLPYYDAINSAFFGCPKCHTFFEYPEIGKPKQLQKFKAKPSMQRTLPLGATGTLKGVPYRVTGYMWRREVNSTAHWEEYQLRHEETGAYHQLAVYQGHWMLLEPTEEQYRVQQGNSRRAFVETTDDTFRLYNRYSPRVLYAEGEFDWNVLDDESLSISEYISPPLMLVRERTATKRVHWFRAQHLDPLEIQNGFRVVNSHIPFRTGTGAIEPAPSQATWPILRTFSLVAALLVVVTHLFLMAWGNETVLDTDFVSNPQTVPLEQPVGSGGDRPMRVSPSFTVPGTGALSIRLSANVDNSWLELPFTVVNEQTGQLFEATRGMEYYHGVEDGESWSEGSTETDALLNSVPAGRYHLNFYPAADASNQNPISFHATVQARASFGSNAFLALVLLLLYPAIQFVRRHYHEQQRWENSDYGPGAAS